MKSLSLATFCAVLCAGVIGAESTVTVTPQEIDALLANPGMGWQTFGRFADQDTNLAGLPSSSAYFRFYWKEVEAEEGRIDFAKFDELLAHARRVGQKLAFRIMCAGTRRDYLYVPLWLKESGCKGFEYQYRGRGPKHWIPDMNDPVFQKAHVRLLEELGKRYDGHPDLDLVDIGTVGHWGEWHMSGTEVPMPSLATRLAIIDAYLRAFPKTPKVMLIGDAEGMKHATEAGCGWRADCLGDWGGFSKNWCHMRNFYPQQIEKTNARDAWKRGPVAFESCWDMRRWKQEEWDIRGTFDFALKYHASYLNNKSASLPEGTRPEVERFIREMGYRLVLRRLAHPAAAQPGATITLTMTWENVGVAPPYHDYLLALRLSRGTDSSVFFTKTSIRGWLPGTSERTESVKLSSRLKPGRYELALAAVDPVRKVPAVRLAIAGRTTEGWYPLSHIEIRTR